MPCNYKEICEDNIRRRGDEFDDIGMLISEQLYSNRAHFIYELLQNAEDALERRFRLNHTDNSPNKVQFILFQNRLEFRHFGVPFNEEDVKGISDVLKGTKKEDFVQIGKFGIGFKSVYAFTASPEIHSGEEHFVIKRYIRPETKQSDIEIAVNETVFNFPFDHKELRAEDAFNLILGKLRDLGPTVLLFLKRINEIEWSVEPDGEKGYYFKESITNDKFKCLSHVNVIGDNSGEEEDEKWLIFERQVSAPDKCQHRVEIGFHLSVAKDGREHILKRNNAPLVVYFPTEKLTMFGFLVQGPYKTTPARDNILKDDDWNKTLINETACLLAELLPILKELNLLTVTLLETMPIRTSDFQEEFKPIVNAVREILIKEELLPTDDNNFVSAQNAKLARGEWLRKVLGNEQLKQLFKTDSDIKWITGEITDTRIDLWNYLREQLDIDVITPDSFASKVDSDFFEKQNDEWFIKFYKQLIGQKSLWNKGYYWANYTNGPLLRKRFIRLQNDKHVEPFNNDGTPNAYLSVAKQNNSLLPIVKLLITNDVDASRFLKELGIPDVDIVAEVIEHIIPKYSTPSCGVPLEEHLFDLEKILQAYKTDSYEKNQRLTNAIKKANIVLATNADTDITIYRRPNEVYFNDNALKLFFSGNNDVGFVSSDYHVSVINMLKGLGVSGDIKLVRKELDYRGFIIIADYHGYHKRGLNGFDPDMIVEGLEHALSAPSLEKSAFIWNHIAIPYSHYIRGTVEQSSRQTYEDCIREECISRFGRLLIEKAWLPGQKDTYTTPDGLSLNELPELFMRDDKLAEQLGMKKDTTVLLAESVGVRYEDIELIKKYPDEFSQWRDSMMAINRKPLFPDQPAPHPMRRQQTIAEQLDNSLEITYEKCERNVRTSENSINQELWLRIHYTNDDEQMVCQICKEEMPFKKRDGKYYFESVQAFSNDYLIKEHEAQYLALCPLCAAKYKEFVKRDSDVMSALYERLKKSEQLELSIKLGDT
ncbi:MAG: hypothetical protein HQK96_16375 [Nitrospirae bacterium]|nr:hypothetical protein [Nitrospirota bacterium]